MRARARLRTPLLFYAFLKTSYSALSAQSGSYVPSHDASQKEEANFSHINNSLKMKAAAHNG